MASNLLDALVAYVVKKALEHIACIRMRQKDKLSQVATDHCFAESRCG